MLKRLLFLTLVTISVMSCNIFRPISLVPSFDAAIVNDITALGKQVDGMYIKMEQSNDKTFASYAADYLSGEVLINSRIARDEARPKTKGSEAILKQANLYRNMYLKNMEDHRVKIKLNNSEIRILKKYLQDQLTPLFVSEMSLK